MRTQIIDELRKITKEEQTLLDGNGQFVKGFIRMANDGWEQGWHEKNGGNLSYRVKPEEVERVKENFEAKEWNLIGQAFLHWQGNIFWLQESVSFHGWFQAEERLQLPQVN